MAKRQSDVDPISYHLVVDTSVIIAVIVREPNAPSLVKLTESSSLIAPPSVHWEVGNAFSAMFKRRRLSLEEAVSALYAYGQIDLTFVDISIVQALKIAHRFSIYAYDAYIIQCGLQYDVPILTLDARLAGHARTAGAKIFGNGDLP